MDRSERAGPRCHEKEASRAEEADVGPRMAGQAQEAAGQTTVPGGPHPHQQLISRGMQRRYQHRHQQQQRRHIHHLQQQQQQPQQFGHHDAWQTCTPVQYAMHAYGAHVGMVPTPVPGPVYYASAFFNGDMMHVTYLPPPGWAYVAVSDVQHHAHTMVRYEAAYREGAAHDASCSEHGVCSHVPDDTAGASEQDRQQRVGTHAHAGPSAGAHNAGWDGLTAGILQIVISKLSDGDVKHMRLVCKHWQLSTDLNMEALTPNELRSKVLTKRFPNLQALHLTNCSNIRNRCLALISKAGLQLQTLSLGDDSCRPWVTNQGLQCIAQMTSLTSLNLHDCNGVTNKGLVMLTNLQHLNTLSLKGCHKLTNGAFEAFQGHSALTHLNLFGCRLTDKGLLPLSGLLLVSLHLGNTRVRDEGLSYLARITTLQELHFEQEELSDAGVVHLTSLTRLESLALRECAGVSGDSLSVLIPALPSLMSLDLNNNFTIDDGQLSRCMEFLGAVTFLDLRGTPVTADGVQQLTQLTQLQKLCLAPTNECLWSPYLCVVSNLTQLTSLSISNCTLISFGQLEMLRQLKLLKELDLSYGTCKHEGIGQMTSQQPVAPTAINAMAAISSLTSIDLSRRPVHQEHLCTLAERLPRLHNLIIVGCPVLYTEVQSLQRRFPDLVIHRRPLYVAGYDTSSCSSSDHGIG